jgi:hypothetical protein
VTFGKHVTLNLFVKHVTLNLFVKHVTLNLLGKHVTLVKYCRSGIGEKRIVIYAKSKKQ